MGGFSFPSLPISPMTYLIYGAYGYTGELIARRAVEQDHSPVLAGRNRAKLDGLASTLDCPFRTVPLSDSGKLRSVLSDVEAVVHCAGPFVKTVGPMVAACLQTGTHYLDITGEIPVFQALRDRGEEARDEGVMLLPGIGFDVVPTDCLAHSLSQELPSATSLELALENRGGLSKGTLKSVIEHMDMGGLVRRNGDLVREPLGYPTRTVNFGEGPRTVVSIPWGDLVASDQSTGIPNVTVYLSLPRLARVLVQLGRYVQWMVASPFVKRLLQVAVDRWVSNPSATVRRRGSTRVWAQVRTDDGERRTARLQGPEAYTFTARAAVQALARMESGRVPPGYQTPATAFGSSFVREIEGVTWNAD